jgi:MFS family permease
VQSKDPTPVPARDDARPTRPDGRADPAAPDPRRWIGLFAALTAPFLGVVDFFVVNLAGPALEKDLGATYAQVELTLALYGLGYAVFVVTGGRLGDTFGRRRVFLAGLLAFVVTSVLVACSTSAWFLLGARLLQGLAAAIVFPQVLALVTVMFPEHERPKALAYFGLTVALASITGQVLGGMLLRLNPLGLGWRALFLVNLPIGTAAFLLARRTLREVRTQDPPTLDVAGVVMATIALAMFVVPLTIGHEQHWPAWSIWTLVGAVPALWAFLALERHAKASGRDPLIDLNLFRSTSYRRGLAMIACYFLGPSAVYLILSLYQQLGNHRDAMSAAQTFLPAACATVVASITASRGAAGHRRLFLYGGMACVLAGIATMVASLALAPGPGGDVSLAAGLALYGFGNGAVSPVLYATILRGVPARSAGPASGVLATVQQVAAVLGITVIGLVFATALRGTSTESYARAGAIALSVNLGSMVLATLLATRLPSEGTGAEVAVAEPGA